MTPSTPPPASSASPATRWCSPRSDTSPSPTRQRSAPSWSRPCRLPPPRLETVCRLDTGSAGPSPRSPSAPWPSSAVGAPTSVVSHGQTVFHWAPDGGADLGAPAKYRSEARLRGRAAGTCAGPCRSANPPGSPRRPGCPSSPASERGTSPRAGRALPLVGLFDALWLAGRPGTVALNLGGIANVTVLPSAHRRPRRWSSLSRPHSPSTPAPPAPCSTPRRATSRTTASPSTPTARSPPAAAYSPDLLARLLDEPYYARPAPKSTGKELFNLDYLLARLGPTPPMPEDLLATLVALTARTVADAVRHTATEVVASGGGITDGASKTTKRPVSRQ